jgi:hypothetical protein
MSQPFYMKDFWPLPDEPHLWIQSLAALGAFVLFLAAALGFGTTIERAIARGDRQASGPFTPLGLAIGSAVLSLFMEFQSIFQALGPRTGAMNWIIILSGALLATRHAWQGAEALFRRPNLRGWGWMAIGPAYLVLLRVLEGFRLHGHGDALYYHLAGPARFFYQGGLFADLDYPQSLQSSSWENLYLWGLQLLAGDGGRGLTLVQCFGQWVHSAIGYGGCGWIVYRWLKQSGIDARLCSIGAMAALSTGGLSWSAHLAKNDWGTAFWFLAGAFLMLDAVGASGPVASRAAPRMGARLAVAGFLMGSGLIGKPIYGVAFLGLLVAFGRPLASAGPGAAAGWLAGAVLAVLPIATRNMWLAGNPLFPWGQSWLPSPLLGPSLARELATIGVTPLRSGAVWMSLLQRLREALVSAPFMVLLPLAAFASVGMPRVTLRRWILAGALTLVTFALVIPRFIEFRYLGPILICAAALSVTGLVPLAQWARDRIGTRAARWAAGPLVAAWVWAFVFSVPPHHVFLQLIPPKWKPLNEQVVGHTNGRAKSWLRLNLSTGESTVLSGDNEVYYLVPHRFQVSSLSRSLDRAIENAIDGPTRLDAARSTGARFILHSPAIPDPRADFRDALNAEAARQPESVVFRFEESAILDLKR